MKRIMNLHRCERVACPDSTLLSNNLEEKVKEALPAIVGLLYLGGLLHGWVRFLRDHQPHADLLCCLLNIISQEGAKPHGRPVQVGEGCFGNYSDPLPGVALRALTSPGSLNGESLRRCPTMSPVLLPVQVRTSPMSHSERNAAP